MKAAVLRVKLNVLVTAKLLNKVAKKQSTSGANFPFRAIVRYFLKKNNMGLTFPFSSDFPKVLTRNQRGGYKILKNSSRSYDGWQDDRFWVGIEWAADL